MQTIAGSSIGAPIQRAKISTENNAFAKNLGYRHNAKALIICSQSTCQIFRGG
jgi:hypothetical protein